MAKEFKLQDPGEGIHEAEIIDVKVSEGDHVDEGDPVLEIETDKAAVEAPSPFSGKIKKIHVKTGDMVEVGDLLISFEEDSAKEPDRKKQVKKEKQKKAPKKKREKKAKRESKEGAEAEKRAGKKAEGTEKKRPPETPVPASPATRRLARELGVDLREVNGSGPGGRVTAEDVRGFAGEPEERRERKEKEKKPPEPKEKVEKEEVPEEKRRPLALPAAVEAPSLPDFSRWGKVERRPLRGIRRATAKQMALAWSQIPHVTHQDVVDITELEKFRQQSKEKVESEDGSLSITVFVMKAAAAALREFSTFNASLDAEDGELVLKRYYHIGAAVDTEKGLVVPVIRDVDRKSVQELSQELTEVAERAREGKLEREEMEGGSFTVTNPGPIGGTAFTPIINYPEVAILGLARARLKPVVDGNLEEYTIAPRMLLPLCLAFDHRVNDGADAARFVRRIKELLADPESFLIGV